MVRAFDRGTYLREIEDMMVQIPHFDKQGTGGKIINIKYRNIACKDCLNWDKKCKLEYCEYISERIELNAVSLEEVIKTEFKRFNSETLNNRISKIAESFDDMYMSKEHKERFNTVISSQLTQPANDPKKYYATLYLLSADETMWHFSFKHIYFKTISFLQIKPKYIDTQGYAIYITAKSIYTSKGKITASECADKELIDDSTLRAITIAMLIERYGLDILALNMRMKSKLTKSNYTTVKAVI